MEIVHVAQNNSGVLAVVHQLMAMAWFDATAWCTKVKFGALPNFSLTRAAARIGLSVPVGLISVLAAALCP
jgi:hypothetical protein